MKGLFYPLPCIELYFCQRVEDSDLIIGVAQKPYDTCNVYVDFLVWHKRFKIKYGKSKYVKQSK